MIWAARLVGAALLIGMLGVLVWVGVQIDRRLFGSSSPPGELVTVTIPGGAGEDKIADILDRAGVIDSSFSFKLDLLKNGDGSDFKPGTYRLRKHERYATIVAVLNAGPKLTVRKLVVPEGYAVRDIERIVRRVGIRPADFREAVSATGPPENFLAKGETASGPDGPSLEGFLFPATYDVQQPVDNRPANAQRLVDQQLAAFERAFGTLDMARARAAGLTRYDVLIIASMVEREAAYPADRPKIAAVIYNRLKAKMPLGIDPTIQYAIGSWRALTAADLEVDSPYNTRTHRGLPPTPIANPGLASLQAAAAPAATRDLYFVAIPGDKQRRHFFTADYKAFLQFQRDHPPTGGATTAATSTAASTG